MFLNFDGNCREAAEFYAKVFKMEVGNLMTYGDATPNLNYATGNYTTFLLTVIVSELIT